MHSVFHFPPETVEFFPENYLDPIESFFPTRPDAPLQIDLGCGDGSFLTAMAALEPGHNFLGVERLLGRIRKTSRRAARAGLGNVRLFRIESHYFVRYLLPRQSVDVVHVLFPDPWPKRRHESRRLIQADFLEAVHAVLKPGGELRLATDNVPYYEQMREVCLASPLFKSECWEPGPEYPQTDFEREYRARGLPVYRLLLRKVDLSR